MLKIRPQIIDEIIAASTATDLHKHLQAAIELEHATIPPYLTALYSIKMGYNREAFEIIRSVVTEEMLHMVIAANVLNAIGGEPQVNHPRFIPTYPGSLPMNVGDGLVVNLASLSKEVLKNTFMAIEEPEDPINFPVLMATKIEEEYRTIGLFYQAIIDKLKELGPSCFTGDRSRQVINEQWFPLTELFPVTNLDEAVAALTLIVKQGEGTSQSPLDPEGKLAHYYRFAEIFYGKHLVKDDTVPEGYSYSGKPIPLETEGLWDLVQNSQAENYQEGTAARRMADQFNFSYTNLLNGLHKTFNGDPDYLNTVMGLMYELKLQAQKMMEITDPISGKQVAPAFQYATVNA